MKKIGIIGICTVVVLALFCFQPAAAEVTLRFSDWHLTEDVWNKSLNEGMAIFHKRYPNIKVTLEPVSYGEKETKYTHRMSFTSMPFRCRCSSARVLPKI